MISAEEVTQELVEAVKTKDKQRFSALVITADELASLGLGTEKAKALKDRIELATKQFEEYAVSQKLLTANSKWAHLARISRCGPSWNR